VFAQKPPSFRQVLFFCCRMPGITVFALRQVSFAGGGKARLPGEQCYSIALASSMLYHT